MEAERDVLVRKIIQLKRDLIEAEDLEREMFANITKKRKEPEEIEAEIEQLSTQRNRYLSVITRTKAIATDCDIYQKQLDTLVRKSEAPFPFEIQQEIDKIETRNSYLQRQRPNCSSRPLL